MKLYRIANRDGDTGVRETTPEEVLKDMEADESDGSEFLTELPEDALDTNYWPERSVLLIRGIIVVPKAKKVVSEWELP